MTNSKTDKQLSKLLSLVLRHKPEKLGILLDENGWTDIDILINRMHLHSFQFIRADIERIVEENDKQRFSIKDNKIRANQGHSVKVDLGLKECDPPDILYHGTVDFALDSIFDEGLKPMGRHHVHLSEDFHVARKVGSRRGKPAVLFIRTNQMKADGIKFYLSENNVWLTDHIPPKYITT